MKEVRIIVAGSRGFDDYKLLCNSINNIVFDLECRNIETGIGNKSREKEKDLIKFISGTARGADALGEKYAINHGYEVSKFSPNWDALGKKAGYVRNAEMAKYAVADGNYGVLIAFWDGKSKGTKHMIDLAEKYGLEVHIVRF